MTAIATTGRVLAGAAGVQGSLDGAPFPFASWGGGAWLDAERALVALAATSRLAEWRPGSEPVPIAAAPNDWSANGGAYVAWLAGYGVYGSVEGYLLGSPGYETPEQVRAALARAGWIGPRTVGPDGTVAFVPDRQVGFGLVVVAPDKRRWDVSGIVPVDVQVLGAGVVAWKGGAIGRAAFRPALANASNTQLHALGGEEWLLYWSEGVGLVLQPDGDVEGWVLDARPLEFNPSCAVVGSELQIAWSTTQGEGPLDVVVCALTLDGAIVYRRRAAGWSPQVPVWQKLLPPKPPTQNRPPTIANPGPQSGAVGDRVSLALSASDPDGDALAFAATGLPAGLSIDPRTGAIAGTLAAKDETIVTASVSDGRGAGAATSFEWIVRAKVEPPKPPTSSYLHHQGANMASIDGKIVRLRGFKGMLLRPGDPNTGMWKNEPGGWRDGILDGAVGDSRYDYRAKAVGDRYTLTHVEHDCLAGEDVGQYSPAIDRAFYHKPSGNTDAGDLELWYVYDGNKNGALEARSEQTTDEHHPAGAGHKFFGSPLTVEVVG